MLVVHATAAWVLIAGCSLGGVAYMVRREVGVGPVRPGRYADLVLTGVGVGMSVASVVLLAAAVIARLQV